LLLEAAATAAAHRQWARYGARDVVEYRGHLLGLYRRAFGALAKQALARHRLSRVQFVGRSVEDLAARGGQLARPPPPVDGVLPPALLGDFHGYQVFHAAPGDADRA